MLVLAGVVVYQVVVDQLRRRLASCRPRCVFLLLAFSSAAFLETSSTGRLSRRRPAGSSGECSVLLVPPVWVSHIFFPRKIV